MKYVVLEPRGWRRLSPLAWICSKLEQRRRNILITQAVRDFWRVGEVRMRLDRKHPIFDMLCARDRIDEKRILANDGLMSQISPAMKRLHEDPEGFWVSLIPWKPRKSRCIK